MELLYFILTSVSVQSVLVLFLVLLLSIWLMEREHSRNMPPGPIQWPIVGCLPQLIFHGADPLSYFQRLGHKYKGLFTVKMGSFRAVYISDYKILREALVTQSGCFSSRPQDFYPSKILAHHNGTRGTVNMFIGHYDKDIYTCNCLFDIYHSYKLVHDRLIL